MVCYPRLGSRKPVPSSRNAHMPPRPSLAQAGHSPSPAERRAVSARLTDAERVDALTEVNLDDLVEALGIAQQPLCADAALRMGRAHARAFAQRVLAMDGAVGELGLGEGSAWGLGALSTTLTVVNRAGVPNHGPLLFVANHPGMTDTIALFAAIACADLRTIAAHRAFLALLPNFSASLIWVDDVAMGSPGALRTAVHHLRAGGALLTFPGGQIEPDPAVQSGLDDALTTWKRSLDLLVRLAPAVHIVPVLVSGVISAQAARSPLRNLRRSRAGRDHLSTMLQLGIPAWRAVSAEVRFGPPLPAAALAHDGISSPATTAAIEMMRALLAQRDAAPAQSARCAPVT